MYEPSHGPRAHLQNFSPKHVKLTEVRGNRQRHKLLYYIKNSIEMAWKGFVFWSSCCNEQSSFLIRCIYNNGSVTSWQIYQASSVPSHGNIRKGYLCTHCQKDSILDRLTVSNILAAKEITCPQFCKIRVSSMPMLTHMCVSSTFLADILFDFYMRQQYF